MAFAALGGLCVLAFVNRDAATLTMSGLSFVGVIALRVGGVPRRSLLVVSLGLFGLIIVIDSGALGHARAVTSAAHLVVSGLLAWAIAAPVKARLEWSRSRYTKHWAAIVIVLVLGAALVWEAGEWAADVIVDVNLQTSVIDSELDLVFALIGALAGALAFGRWHPGDGRARSTRPAA